MKPKIRILWERLLDGTVLARVSLWRGTSPEYGECYEEGFRYRMSVADHDTIREAMPSAQWLELAPERADDIVSGASVFTEVGK